MFVYYHKFFFFLRFEALILEFLMFKKKKILEKLLEIAFHFEAKNDFFFNKMNF